MSFVLEPGQAVGGRYELVRLLAMGGMGQVWVGHDTKEACAVALKFVKDPQDGDARARMLREARASRSIRHPAVVPITDVVENDSGELALVMELLEGEPLSARPKPIPAREAAPLLLQVCEALSAAHQVGIVHRDVKPDNIFLTRSGQVKLLDFGIAKRVLVDEATAQSIGTKTGTILGTPQYMSPEQVFGDSDVDRRTDVWSLGLVLYECLTGVLPTRSDSLGQILKIIATDSIRSVAAHSVKVPSNLVELVDRMLRRERDKRPETKEIAGVLAAIATGEDSGITTPALVVRVGESDSSDGLGETEAPVETASAASALSGDSWLRDIAALPKTAEQVEPDRSGQRVAHYQVGETLGQGGMGIVYAAEDVRLRRKVALKVLPQALVIHDERRRRFLREARAASSVQHPNVATVFDVGESDGTVWIAMEYVKGQTLRALLKAEGGRLERERALEIGRQMAKGLACAHASGVIHRDIKPENVIVSADGTVKVLDFGLAKLTHQEREDDARHDASTVDDLASRLGRVMGTPAYMSPEQAAGEPVDARTDIYAMGIVLHEMLTGVRPPRAEAPGDARRRSRLPAAIASVIDTCLSPDRADRYTGGAELEAALAGVEKKTRFGLGTAAALVAALALGVVMTAVIAARPKASSNVEPTESPSGSSSVSSALTVVNHLNEPPPSTTNPEALALYRRGRALQHEADWTGADALFRNAIELDPNFGEAYLQLAFKQWMDGAASVERGTHDLYRHAVDARARMNERTRRYVLALEPVLSRDPPDWARALELIDELLKDYPTDIEIHHARAQMRYRAAGFFIVEDIERMIALDPEYADAWQYLIGVRMDAGRFSDAVDAVEHCHQLSPNSKECSLDAAILFRVMGQCERAAEEGKRALGVNEWSNYPYVLLGLGRPREVVLDAFEKSWEVARGYPQNFVELFDRAALALYDGDSDHAMAFFRAAGEDVAKREAPENFRWQALEGVGFTAYESGTLKSVESELRAAMSRQVEWASKGNTGDNLTGDGSIILWSILRKGGVATGDEVEAARARFQHRWARELAKRPTLAWSAVYGAGIESRDDALSALEKAPRTLEKTELDRYPWFNVPIGKALLRAGRPGEAIPWLRALISQCLSWRSGYYDFIQAQSLLGQALDATGDSAGACESYGVVLKHWGDAKPAWLTAEAVRKRAQRLGCKGEVR